MRILTTALFCVSVLSIVSAAGCQQPQQAYAPNGYADPYAGQNQTYNTGSASRTAQPIQQPVYQNSGGSGSR